MLSLSSTSECLVVSEDQMDWQACTHVCEPWPSYPLKSNCPSNSENSAHFSKAPFSCKKPTTHSAATTKCWSASTYTSDFFIRLLLNSVRNHKTRFHSWYSHMTESFLSILLLTNHNPKLFTPKADEKLPLQQETSGLPEGSWLLDNAPSHHQLKCFRNQR